MTDDWQTFQFGQPWVLGLLPLLAFVLWRLGRAGPATGLLFSSVSLVRSVGGVVRPRAAWRRDWLKGMALLLLIIALAQPRLERAAVPEPTQAIDIVLLVDASRSMETTDFDAGNAKISRLEALRRVVGDFVKARPRDRIGVIGFAEKPFLLCPLTLDHSWMMESLASMETSLGTAIGSSVEAGIDLLRAGGNQSCALILITDGLNTSGSDPLKAAQLAAAAGIRLYTIAAVSYDQVVTDDFASNPLYVMAQTTGGKFFQAGNTGSLQSIYGEIDRLERQRLMQLRNRRYQQLYYFLAIAAVALLLTETSLSATRWLRVP